MGPLLKGEGTLELGLPKKTKFSPARGRYVCDVPCMLCDIFAALEAHRDDGSMYVVPPVSLPSSVSTITWERVLCLSCLTENHLAGRAAK